MKNMSETLGILDGYYSSTIVEAIGSLRGTKLTPCHLRDYDEAIKRIKGEMKRTELWLVDDIIESMNKFSSLCDSPIHRWRSCHGGFSDIISSPIGPTELRCTADYTFQFVIAIDCLKEEYPEMENDLNTIFVSFCLMVKKYLHL